jgi:hypothetical protein
MAKRAGKARRKRPVANVAAKVLQAISGKPPALTAKGTRTPTARLLARAKRPPRK